MVAQAPKLYIVIEGNSLKIGSCGHCVIDEKGRPETAWDPDGDRELDFDRDLLIQGLASHGVMITSREEFVCL